MLIWCHNGGALILSLLVALGITLHTAKTPEKAINPEQFINQMLDEAPRPDYDLDVLIPLRQKQAIDAKIEQDRINAQIGQTRNRVQAPFAYRSSYYFGNCTWYVAGRIAVPSDWGNANTWYEAAAAAGWPTNANPRVGAIATTRAGWWGHVAIVEAIEGDMVQVSEMNYAGFDVIDYRWAPADEFAYIY